MATPENTFIASVHRHLPVSLYRMKNHNQYTGGIADVWYSGPAGDLWIEYKFLVPPKRDDTIVSITSGKDPMLSHLQQEWLTQRHSEGRRVGVIIGSKNGGVWAPNLEWVSPLTSGQFRERLLSRNELAAAITALTTLN